MLPKLEVKCQDLPVKVWTVDESRFGLLTTRRRRLTLRGVKPLLECRHEFENTYLYSAIEPLAGESFFLELPYVVTTHFQIFVDYFARAYQASLNLFVLDNGSYHTTARLTRPNHVRFIFTPPYTPEVNPIERFFEDVKDKVTRNPNMSIDQLSAKLEIVLRAYTKGELSRLTSYPFFRKGAQSVSLKK